jgi:hypothetical protein
MCDKHNIVYLVLYNIYITLGKIQGQI